MYVKRVPVDNVGIGRARIRLSGWCGVKKKGKRRKQETWAVVGYIVPGIPFSDVPSQLWGSLET